MAARRKSKVTPKFKTICKVKNWATYEAALRNRGNITLPSGQTVTSFLRSTRRLLTRGTRPRADVLEANVDILTLQS